MLLGRLEADDGRVCVLGHPPHTRGHDIPGTGVGYSPQEIALYIDLTIWETLKFHGQMHGITITKEHSNENDSHTHTHTHIHTHTHTHTHTLSLSLSLFFV